MRIEEDLKTAISKSSRIFIVGAAGSGKSTLAHKIAKEKQIKHIELDDFFRETKYTKKAEYSKYRHIQDCEKYGCNYMVINNI